MGPTCAMLTTLVSIFANIAKKRHVLSSPIIQITTTNVKCRVTPVCRNVQCSKFVEENACIPLKKNIKSTTVLSQPALCPALSIVEEYVTTLTIFTLKLILKSVFICVTNSTSAKNSANKKEFVKSQSKTLNLESGQHNRVNSGTLIPT